MAQGIGGTPDVDYEKDVEYWVRWLQEQWISSVIPQDIIQQVRSAPDMFAARKFAMDFHDSMMNSQ